MLMGSCPTHWPPTLQDMNDFIFPSSPFRRVKNVLLTDAIDSITKLVKKGKRVTKDTIKERNEKVSEG